MGKQNYPRRSSAQRPARPKKEYLPLIRRTSKLIDGRSFRVKLPQLGVIAYGRLAWVEEDYPDIDCVSYRPLDNTPAYFKRLVRKDLKRGDDLLHEEVCQAVFKSTPFKKMKEEIKAICDEVNKMEKQSSEFDWVRDVLDYAEGPGLC